MPAPRLHFGSFVYSFSGSWASYELIAAFFFVGFVFARFVVRSPVGDVLNAIRQNPLRTAALGHDVHAYKLSVFVLAAIFAGCAGALLGIFQGYMPPNAFTLETSGQLVIQTVIGGAGTLIGPTIGAAIWLVLRQVLQQLPAIGSLWLFILGLVFVLLVTFLPKGIVGATARLGSKFPFFELRPVVTDAFQGEKGTAQALLAPFSTAGTRGSSPAELALHVRNVSKAYGGIHAVEGVSLELPAGRFHAIIGPNGAGKSTFLRLLNCEERPDTGRILLNGIDITGIGVTRAHQHGLAKSFQINQLFPQFTVRQNLRIGALSRLRGPLRLDVFRPADGFSKIELMLAALLDRLGLTPSADVRVSSLPYGEKRRLELGLALASRPSVLLLDEPLAGLSPHEREGIKRLIQDVRGGRTIVLVEHDMDAVFQLAERITVLHEGRKLAEGTPQEISADRRVREAYLGGIAA